MKRVVIIADTHCGHRSGLTPPDWQYPASTKDPTRAAFGDLQRIMWNWYVETIDKLGPIDTLIHNGDAIDGKGERSEGTEELTTDCADQVEMAAMCIAQSRAKRNYLIYGTPYHTGNGTDWEGELAKRINADHVGSHDWYESDGVVIDCKHKVGSSCIPHGRHTAPARAALWNTLWAERGLQAKADILVRSHVHYYSFCGGPDRLTITTPCLQGWTKYGGRQCEGTVDIGLISIDLLGEGRYTWTVHLLDMRFAGAQTLPI